MKSEELKKQYQGLKVEFECFEKMRDMFKGLRQDMENQNPYKVIDAAIDKLENEMKTLREDMDFYLDRMIENDKEEE